MAEVQVNNAPGPQVIQPQYSVTKIENLNFPYKALLHDERNKIYVANWGSDTVDLVDLMNESSNTVLENINGPTDIIFDKHKQSIIIACLGDRYILRFPLDGSIPGGEKIVEDIDCYGLAMDNDGTLYVTDIILKKVIRFSPSSVREELPISGLSFPSYMCFDGNDNLFISDSGSNCVFKWSQHSGELIAAVPRSHVNGQISRVLDTPMGILVDDAGRIYVAESGSHKITRWILDRDEADLTIPLNDDIILFPSAPGQNILPGSIQDRLRKFNQPHHLFFNQKRELCVVDEFNHRIVIFSSISGM